MTWQAVIAERFRRALADAVRAGFPLALPPLPGVAEAAAVRALAGLTHRLTVWIGAGQETLETMHRNLLALGLPGEAPPGYFPPPPAVDAAGVSADADCVGYRLEALTTLLACRAAPAAGVWVTCIQALQHATLPPERLETESACLRAGGPGDRDELVAVLERAGYDFRPLVDGKGQAAVRGGLIDVWPLDAAWPVRIEFDLDQVGSLRTFDPGTQRSRERQERVTIVPAREGMSAREAAGGPPATFIDYLPPGCLFVWSDPDAVRLHGRRYHETALEGGVGLSVLTPEALETMVGRLPDSATVSVHDMSVLPGAATLEDLEPIPGFGGEATNRLRPDLLEQARDRLLDLLLQKADKGDTVVLALDTAGAVAHFEALLAARWPAAAAGQPLPVVQAALSPGFFSESMALALVTQPDLYGGLERRGARYDPVTAAGGTRPRHGGRVADLSELEPGDLVVHVEHGIGRYLGLTQIVFNERPQEVLSIEYAEGAKLHVPVSQAHLLSRYRGAGRSAPTLHRLGGRRWTRERAAAEQAIADLAAELLETQAHRDVVAGVACGTDTAWQHEFEAAFPYRETRDQHTVIAAVKRDMEASRSMDRLVCGDAGYGKTEVAMRAAFKAVMDQRQVAVLVPTTVLAQQHFETFAARMADYPVRIEMLSRFCSQRQRSAIIKGLSVGTVDIVIGTHALVHPGIGFKNLALVIVDEEQRFGVKEKEAFKRLRRTVDVLTLTATPIPRTLYMSLAGIRDLSLLQTPPLERQAVETLVARYSEALVREAVLRELDRDGQVFYLHNRVMTIDAVAARLGALIPEARFGVAHGQMAAGELAEVMHGFVRGDIDVLVCTTIVESGVDIPRANTILIDRADRFGIADLYQLRGRVGRASWRAYAYLLLPAQGVLEAEARRRVEALRRYSGLSAGFNLALQDLEIRGAGNMLGSLQSGHISAIGFGLYCQLLKRTSASLKGEPPPRLVDVDLRLDFIDLAPLGVPGEAVASIPYDYIEDEGLRVGFYRRLAEAGSRDDLDTFRRELTDRFGPIPPAVHRLLRLSELRLAAADQGVQSIEVRDGKVMLSGPNGYLMRDTRFPRLAPAGIEARLDALLRWIQTAGQWGRK